MWATAVACGLDDVHKRAQTSSSPLFPLSTARRHFVISPAYIVFPKNNGSMCRRRLPLLRRLQIGLTSSRNSMHGQGRLTHGRGRLSLQLECAPFAARALQRKDCARWTAGLAPRATGALDVGGTRSCHGAETSSSKCLLGCTEVMPQKLALTMLSAAAHFARLSPVSSGQQALS